MVVGDLNKVWEIKALVRKPEQEKAKNLLERIAKQVQPIMQKHKWRVKILSEMCPTNPRLLGLNVGAGINVKLRLRRPNKDLDFIPYDQVLDTMLHELCHNAHGPHNASFYKLWDELRKECEELMSKGISGSGQGFDLPGKRLGGFSRQPPLSSLRKTALNAAQDRQRIASLLPSGPNRLGGDTSIMSSLSPIQAAAMAAERRLQDEIWCASASGNIPVEEIFADVPETNLNPQQGASSSSASRSTKIQSSVTVTKKRSIDTLSATTGKRIRQSDPSSDPLSIIDQNIRAHDKDEETMMWECETCTLLNPPLAPVCAVCVTPKPKVAAAKYKSWSCKFCTLENGVELEKCLACGQWRYSHGAPISTSSPNLGT